ncbi:hypothetical protein L6452_08540 [Arctium lappa]|uniref:Uncharacterized protein n=1 Tax=Arctium lappa TaxID=4217 RepID=A0ACB9DIE1_ARCLA|nr:hypothetical protein L6452_08540 [Arctium lappa]
MVVSDKSLEFLAINFQGFKSLSLLRCDGFSTGGLKAIATHCKSASNKNARCHEKVKMLHDNLVNLDYVLHRGSQLWYILYLCEIWPLAISLWFLQMEICICTAIDLFWSWSNKGSTRNLEFYLDDTMACDHFGLFFWNNNSLGWALYGLDYLLIFSVTYSLSRLQYCINHLCEIWPWAISHFGVALFIVQNLNAKPVANLHFFTAS